MMARQRRVECGSPVRDQQLWCSLAQNNVVHVELSHVERSATLKSFCFGVSGKAIGRDDYPLISRRGGWEGAQKVNSDLLERCSRYLYRLQQTGWASRRCFLSLTFVAGANVVFHCRRKLRPVVVLLRSGRCTRITKVMRRRLVMTGL